MNNRFDRYNEITFVKCCLKAAAREVRWGREQKAKRANMESLISDLSESILLIVDNEIAEIENTTYEPITFDVYEYHITVRDGELAQALRALPPKKRNVILLDFFLEAKDAEIGQIMNLAKSTVKRRRAQALEMLRQILEDEE